MTKLYVLLITMASFAHGQTVVHSFSGPDGIAPVGSMVFDQAGNIYGVSEGGGDAGYGVLYRLGTDGQIAVLHSFPGPSSPTAGLTMDAAGNIFGTTAGWINHCPPTCGDVFELPFGSDTLSILYTFKGGKDGGVVSSGATLDTLGNVYGATSQNGPRGYGTVFKLTNTNGVWKKKIIHSFALTDKSGGEPNGNLAIDANGNLYGANLWGGVVGFGAIFKLTPNAKGGYSIGVPHAFGLSEKQTWAGVSLDARGLHGTMPYSGGKPYIGTAYVVTPKPKSGWTRTTIHRFSPTGDGENPMVNPISDANGNLYGTTEETAYQLGADGHSFNVLQWFPNDDARLGTLVFGPDGELYGTTQNGGNNALGMIWKMAVQ